MTDQDIRTPENWTVETETISGDGRSPVILVVEITGPSDEMSPEQRTRIAARIGQQAAQEWATAQGLGTPYLSGASHDGGWRTEGRFLSSRRYRTA